MFLNTRVPPFNRLDARRALNYAVDRRAASPSMAGPRRAAHLPDPAAQLPRLPALLPVHGRRRRRRHVDRARPRPGAAPGRPLAHTRGMAVTVLGIRAGSSPVHARLMRKVLDELGYKATLRLLPADKYFAYAPRNRPQIGHIYYTSDYPAASDFLQVGVQPAGRRSCFRDSAIRPATGSWSARSGCRPESPVGRRVGAGGAAGRRPGSGGPAHERQVALPRFASGRRLPVQPADGCPLRPALGALRPSVLIPATR